MNYDMRLTLLSEKEILWDEQLEVLKKYGAQAAGTDLVILTGGHDEEDYFHITPDGTSLRDRTGFYYTKSSYFIDNYIQSINYIGNTQDVKSDRHLSIAIRPVLLLSSSLYSQIYQNRFSGYNETEEVEYGEYPQYVPADDIQELLEQELKKGCLHKTGKNYTFNSRTPQDASLSFQPITYDEYEYKEKKYIRIVARDRFLDCDLDCNKYFKLSNGKRYKTGDNVWVEVTPVRWLIDDENYKLISKRGLLAGLIFHNGEYNGDFLMSDMKQYLDKYMLHDLFQNESLTLEKQEDKENQKLAKKINNPYNLNLEQVSEEDIIRGAIESGIAVFLHGPSSEGKSARVMQIDPDSVIIYLRNATPESLNGKSVYNQKTGEMIEIKPTWLKKLETKCEKEPDKLHIVFFDEITNALPSIQGIAFNIVLDREVNGMWKLPDNARIVAAGNEMKDSLAANELAEPLFNRFAHVYIKTTTEGWLKWASENNIHPAIYSYIAYKKGETLRSKYDGEKPNADPRKWEMASKMLYSTKNPEMLRSLVGEDITKEFVAFCNQSVITLEDVITGNYSDIDIQSLDTASRYATVSNLSQVDEENLDTVRKFITMLGTEFLSIFDSMWAHGDEERLELIAEARLSNTHMSRKKKIMN